MPDGSVTSHAVAVGDEYDAVGHMDPEKFEVGEYGGCWPKSRTHDCSAPYWTHCPKLGHEDGGCVSDDCAAVDCGWAPHRTVDGKEHWEWRRVRTLERWLVTQQGTK